MDPRVNDNKNPRRVTSLPHRKLTNDVGALAGLTSSCAWASVHKDETIKWTEGASAGLPIKTPLYSIIALQASFVQLSLYSIG